MNHTGEVTFTCRFIHSLPLLMSAVQVFYHDRMAAVAHLIGSDQIPLPEQVYIFLDFIYHNIIFSWRKKKNINKISLVRGSCKKFCHWVRITSVLPFIKHIFIANLQSIPPLLKHIFVTFLPSREKQINTCSLLLVSVGDSDK